MKKILLLILVCLIAISGCSLSDLGKIKVINDEIDNAKIVLLQVVYKSSDAGFSNYRALITYSKKIKENEPDFITVNFKIDADLDEINLVPKCYLVAGEQKYELTLDNISAKTESYSRTESSLDDKDEVHVYTTYIIEGDLSLSSEITNQIEVSEKLMYRLYLGSRPLTFKISQKNLELLKTFIDTK